MPENRAHHTSHISFPNGAQAMTTLYISQSLGTCPFTSCPLPSSCFSAYGQEKKFGLNQTKERSDDGSRWWVMGVAEDTRYRKYLLSISLSSYSCFSLCSCSLIFITALLNKKPLHRKSVRGRWSFQRKQAGPQRAATHFRLLFSASCCFSLSRKKRISAHNSSSSRIRASNRQVSVQAQTRNWCAKTYRCQYPPIARLSEAPV